MYSKEQVIDFVKYSMSKIDSDESLESIFNKWELNIESSVEDSFLMYFSKLKSPYAEQAIENYDQSFCDDYLGRAAGTLDEALIHGFDWKISPQGVKYWRDIYDNIDKYLK